MDVSRVVARASVPVNDLRFCKVGNSATISAADSGIEIQGRVTVVSPALDPNSTTAEVWIQAPNTGERLRPGSTVHVEIITETVSGAIVIPRAALLPSPEGTGDNVLVVGSDSLAHRRQVEIGIGQPDVVQVVKGLNPGEQVIVVGGLGVEDKTKVKVENEPTGKSGKSDESKSEK